MRVEFFVPSGKRPPNLLAEAEVHFDAMTVGDGGHSMPSPFAGLRLVGFSVWRGDHGTFATLPGKSFGVGQDRRFFDFVRPSNGDREAISKLKRWIVEEYKHWAAGREVAAYHDISEPRHSPRGEEF